MTAYQCDGLVRPGKNLAHLVTHMPGRYEQTVRYYGYYSNKSRGLRKKAETDDDIPVIVKLVKGGTAARFLPTGHIVYTLESHFQDVSVRPSSRRIGNFNRRHTMGVPRIEISDQRRDQPNWGVLKLALM